MKDQFDLSLGEIRQGAEEGIKVAISNFNSQMSQVEELKNMGMSELAQPMEASMKSTLKTTLFTYQSLVSSFVAKY